MPENRHGTPSRLSDRRIGSAAAFVADEDGEVARRAPRVDPPGDVGGDPVRLLRAGGERLVADRGGARRSHAPRRAA